MISDKENTNDKMFMLKNWRIDYVTYNKKGYFLHGDVYNNPIFRNGKSIDTTSMVDIVTCENGIVFLDATGTSLLLWMWMWMYLQVIIAKSRYDLLDKTVKLIYEKNNYNFTEIANGAFGAFTTMTYSEFIFLLYRRYSPETSDLQIIEKLLDSSYFRTLHSR